MMLSLLKVSITRFNNVRSLTDFGIAFAGKYPRSKSHSIANLPESGDDAFFVASSGKSVLFGVLDGVGGWREEGIDPSEFSWGVSTRIVHAVARKQITDPKLAMQTGYDDYVRSCGGPNSVRGSATCLVASLTPSAKGYTLSTANVGDCSLSVMRCSNLRWREVFRTEEGRIGNFPYQLGCHRDGCTPQKSVLSEYEVLPGDLVVTCTDGVTDNIDTMEHTFELLKFPVSCTSQSVSEALVKFALQQYIKPDDTTAVVTRITSLPVA